MAKKKSNTPSEQFLLLPTPPSTSSIVDTHTHLASTFSNYRHRYKSGKFEDVHQFIQAMYKGRNVDAIVDVWCEAPVQKLWRSFADSAVKSEDREKIWAGMEYWFVMGTPHQRVFPLRFADVSEGVHPYVLIIGIYQGLIVSSAFSHEAKLYNDDVEKDIIEAMSHPRCVGWGEMGLDYHYDNSPREVQQAVFARQLRNAVRLGKPLTIHTREADDDTERILKEIVPQDHKIHIHCFTDSPAFAQRLLDHFPNLYIGITGVITYSTNKDTSTVIREMVARNPGAPLRILLETDAPYMVPSNLYDSLQEMKGKLPVCHSAMVPWTAAFVANVAGEGWTADRVMTEARENARKMYGV
ncbi:hypothetical protein H0H81_000226 [Sphagnurus paluster]|uniref:Metallo-dependent hydrolase n=1 Tax=Sphagnurus paluster TaxID=117069 RepID=A0A9P7GV19_9AGAR|nr:hypothetical protein H0H81_000226 [Sphagnurus paluster]